MKEKPSDKKTEQYAAIENAVRILENKGGVALSGGQSGTLETTTLTAGCVTDGPVPPPVSLTAGCVFDAPQT